MKKSTRTALLVIAGLQVTPAHADLKSDDRQLN